MTKEKEVKSTLKRLKEEVKVLEGNFKLKRDEYQKLTVLCDEAYKKREDAIAEIKLERARLEKEKIDISNDRDKADKEIENIKIRIRDIEEQDKQIKLGWVSLHDAERALTKKKQDHEEEFKLERSRLTKKMQDVEQMEQDNIKNRNKIEEKEQKFNDRKDEIASLLNDIDSEKEYTSMLKDKAQEEHDKIKRERKKLDVDKAKHEAERKDNVELLEALAAQKKEIQEKLNYIEEEQLALATEWARVKRQARVYEYKKAEENATEKNTVRQ